VEEILLVGRPEVTYQKRVDLTISLLGGNFSLINTQRISTCAGVVLWTGISAPGVRFVEILTEAGSFPIQEIEVSSSSSPNNAMAGVSSAPSGQEGFYLLISRYHETNAGRKGELDLVLERNLRNPHLEEVHILSETCGTLSLPARAMKNPKMFVHCLPHQPTYADFFHFANIHLRGKRVVLSNADIAFTASLGKLGDHPLSSERRVLILSRWALDCGEGRLDPRGNLCWTDYGSHDTFIFRAPLPPESFQDLEFPMNRYFAEHAVVARLVDTGFEVVNPCLDIISLHHHVSGLREWTKTGEELWALPEEERKFYPVHVGHLPLEYC